MADPEQIYQEVLQEEQQRGSPTVIAEARAKAARVRAEHGSPHPKEPKWWPGAQPHLEGDGAGPVGAVQEAAPGEAPAEAPVEEAPPPEEVAAPAEQPAAAADTAAPPGEVTPDSAPAEVATAQPEATTVPPAPDRADVAPAPAPAAQAPAAAAPAAAAPVATTPATATELPPEQRPAGVTHGTTTGTRLRPEDEVATDAQFEGQRAMYERRKLIDELVATGVPEVTAGSTGRGRTAALALLYILVPLLAISLLSGLSGGSEGAATTDGGNGGGGGGGADVTLVAQNIQFDQTQISLAAGEPQTIEFHNEEPPGVQHNVAIYEQQGGPTLFKGEIIDGGESITYEVEPMEPGDYYFHCDVHPAMNGTVAVE